MSARLEGGAISSVADFVAEVQQLFSAAARQLGADLESPGARGGEAASALREVEEELKELQAKW